jgi:DNA-directed RNA polymerase specialized sigma24 family protein
VSLAEADGVSARTQDLIALDEADSARKVRRTESRHVELRYFGGLTSEEAAEVLGISPRTADREWEVARLWLFRFLAG